MRHLCLFLLYCWVLAASAAETTPDFTLPELNGGKVLISWEELKKLLEQIEQLKRAGESLETPEEPALPAAFSIGEARFDGAVQGNSARFEATFTVHVLQKGWNVVPFFAAEVGIESLRISPAEQAGAAQFIYDEHGYSLLAQGPASLSVQAVLHVPVRSDESVYRLDFTPPRAVINRFLLRIPESGVQMLETPAQVKVETLDAVTRVEAVQRDALRLAWRVERDGSASRKSAATQHTLVSVDRTELTLYSSLTLEYVTDLTQVKLRLPTTVEILNLTSPDIERWSSVKTGDSQLISFSGTARTPFKLDLSYRLQLQQLPLEVTLPVPEVEGVDKLEGFLGVEVLGNLEATAKETLKGSAVPPKNLPKSLWQRASSPLLYGYQFYQPGFAAELSVRGYQEIQTVVANADLAEAVTLRTLEGRSMSRVRYAIRNNDRQFLTLRLPDNSRVWQAFVDGKPVKPAQKDGGEVLIPMKKSDSQGEELKSFSIEVGYITEVSRLSLKGDVLNQLPAIDVPISYLRWSLFLPEYYEYSGFEGPLKQVSQFSTPAQKTAPTPQIEIPLQGQLFQFEKHLIVSEMPYVRGHYGQFLGDDILLSVPGSGPPVGGWEAAAPREMDEMLRPGGLSSQVIPNRALRR